MTKVLWNFTGDASVLGGSVIHDFRYQHDQLCSAAPFASYDYPAHALTGTPPPLNFDSIGTSQDRLDIAAEYPKIPFTVDVDKLSDLQINSLCLTVEDCQVPPQLTVVRNKDGSIWKPHKKILKNENLPNTFCCNSNVNSTSNGVLDSNYYTTQRLPPASYRIARTKAGIILLSQEFFPRGSTVENAKIIKVNFSYKGADLYFYVDMTCGTARGFYRRKGFTGQWNSRLNGLFAEVVFRHPKYPNPHSVVRLDKGFISKRWEFGDTKNHNVGFWTVKMGGVGSNVGGANERYEWLAVRNYWFVVSKLDNHDIVVALMKSGLEWFFLSAPKGKWPVVLVYFLAAQMAFEDNLAPDTVLDFSIVKDYTGVYYTKVKPALDYLAEVVDGTPRFMHAKLKGSECINKLPKAYLNAFLNNRKAPEMGCIEMSLTGGFLTCESWCSASCEPFIDIILAARALVWNLQQEVPRCSQCPGLIGIFRDSIPDDQTDHPLYSIGKQPQCLPVVTPAGNVYDSISVGYELYKPDFSTCLTCTASNSCVPTD